jgi:hypothetical protein
MDDKLPEVGLAQDLVAMWQSEFTAMAADREIRESWTALFALWAQTASAMAKSMARHDAARGSASPPQPAGSAPLAPASDAGLGEVERLGRRVAELEQRLAEFLRAGRGDAGPRPPAGDV